VQLYVILPSPLSSSTNAVYIASGSYINDAYDQLNCASDPQLSCSLPVASDFEIFTNSNGTVGDSNGTGYFFGGILYAPAASLTEDGCKSHYYGSVVVYAFTCNGAPNFSFSYDNAELTDYGAWTQGTYSQVPPSRVVFPSTPPT